MPIRAPDDARLASGHRTMPVPADVSLVELFRSTHCIYIDISLLKTKKNNIKIYIWLEQLRMINMQQTRAIESSASVVFIHLHDCQAQP